MTRLRHTITLLLTPVLAGGLALGQEPRTAFSSDPSQPVQRRIDDLLGRMTLEEKVGQMNMPCVYEAGLGKDIAAKTEAVQKFAAGTLVPSFGPGGGFFTLPNTILHQGPRQQAEFLNRLQKLARQQTRWAFPCWRRKKERTA